MCVCMCESIIIQNPEFYFGREITKVKLILAIDCQDFVNRRFQFIVVVFVSFCIVLLFLALLGLKLLIKLCWIQSLESYSVVCVCVDHKLKINYCKRLRGAFSYWPNISRWVFAENAQFFLIRIYQSADKWIGTEIVVIHLCGCNLVSYHSKATQTCMCYRFTAQMLKYPFQVLNNLRTENCRETADIHDENRLLFRGHKDHRTWMTQTIWFYE